MKSVLIVDDDEALCRTLEIQLEIAGHPVRAAFSGEKGLSVAIQWQPDLVLLDIYLPDQNGFNILPQIQKRLPWTKIILMSSFARGELEVDILQSRGVLFLKKPFDFDCLLKILAS